MFIYLGTTLTNENSIQEDMKSRLKSGNACYHSVENLVFFLGGGRGDDCAFQYIYLSN